MVGDREEIGGQRPAFAVEPTGVAPQGEEDLLHHVLRELAVDDDPAGEGVAGGAIAVVERFERPAVTLGHEGTQRSVAMVGVRR